MAERARVVTLPPVVAEGDEVIVYRRVNDIIDADSLRLGEVLYVQDGEARIMFSPSFEGAFKYVSSFGAIPNTKYYKQRSWDIGLSERIYFATMDEDFL